jgi:hypothetical protein
MDQVGEDYSTARPSPAKRRPKKPMVTDGQQLDSVLRMLNSKMDGAAGNMLKHHRQLCLCLCLCAFAFALVFVSLCLLLCFAFVFVDLNMFSLWFSV